jgi:tRNA-2-methylthio-N6-dimethylallyladenosine synthase
MPGRYYIKTFGCQMNEYDSTRMGDVLGAGAGLTPTDNPAEADVLLMNTCSVREKAEDKVYSLLGEWRALKKARASPGAHPMSTWYSGRRPCIACPTCSAS